MPCFGGRVLRKGSGSGCSGSPQLDCFFIEKGSSNLLMAQACLTYLFQYNMPGATTERSPFLGYAWWQWDKHVHLQEEAPLGIDQGIFRKKALEIYSKLSRIKTRSIATLSLSVSDELSHSDQILERNYLKWMPASGLDRLLESLNLPFFVPDYDSFFTKLDPQCSVYGSLPLDYITQCRFLEVLPCLDIDTPIRCRLVRDDLKNQPRYIATSYFWDAQHCRDLVFVNGEEFRLYPSQARICKLLRSRKEGSISRIWIDVPCINQVDKEERIAQINLMGQIYRQAQGVVVHLGAEPTNARRGLALLERLAMSAQQSQDAISPVVQLGRSQALESLQELEKPGVVEALAFLYHDEWTV